MAVADVLFLFPSPPPPLIMGFVLAPILALALVAPDARPYLCYATALVLPASSLAAVVASLVWGEGSAPVLFLDKLRGAARKVGICLFVLFLAHKAHAALRTLPGLSG